MSKHPYETLTLERVMDAVEALGYCCNASNIALNSYENRVYQVGITDEAGNDITPIIVKFYRPDRWSQAAIKEEHVFVNELARHDIPVVCPININNSTVFSDGIFYYSIFPRKGGYSPELGREEDLEILGQWLGRLHNVGSTHTFAHRPTLELTRDIYTAQKSVIDSKQLPADYKDSYNAIIENCLLHIERQENDFLQQTKEMGVTTNLRIHGDMHLGNLMLRDEQLHIVDFDDCINGLAMQDIWMLLSGEREEQRYQLLTIYEGYEQFRPFPTHEIQLIDCLRTRRIVRHAAWLAQRWTDPAFPMAFPYFASHRYWSEHIVALQEQLAALQEEPLSLPLPI